LVFTGIERIIFVVLVIGAVIGFYGLLSGRIVV